MASKYSTDYTQQINVKMSVRLKLRLNKLHERHRIPPSELLRSLGEAAVNFSEKHGHFSFPVAIVPERNVSKDKNPQYIAAQIKNIDTRGGSRPPKTTNTEKIDTNAAPTRRRPHRVKAA